MLISFLYGTIRIGISMVVNNGFLNHWYIFHKKYMYFFSATSAENRYLRFSIVTSGPASRAVRPRLKARKNNCLADNHKSPAQPGATKE